MFICNVYPKQTWMPLFLGSWIEPIGLALLTYALTKRNVVLVNIFLALSGVGTGIRFMPGTLHAVGIEPTRIAPVISLMSFVVPLGGTLGLSIMGSVFNNKMASGFASLNIPGMDLGGGGGHDTGRSSQSIDEINNLPPDIREAVRNICKDAVVWSYVAIIPLLALAGIAACFLGNVQITSVELDQMVKENKGEVVDEPYLFWLIKNRRRLGGDEGEKKDVETGGGVREKEGEPQRAASQEAMLGSTT